MISDEYRKLNEELHRTHQSYGARGHRHLDDVRKLMEQYETTDVLDYGCGKATLSKEIGCKNYDPCVPEYSALPESADILVCTDVLEHVEPEHIDEVLEHLHSLCKKAALLVVATVRDRSKRLPDGSEPHRIVKPAEWWADKIGRLFEIEDTSSNDKDVTFVLTCNRSVEVGR